MKIRVFILFSLMLFGAKTFAQEKHTLSGFIKDESTGEELIGVAVFVQGSSIGAITNEYGFYSLTLPEGTYSIVYSFIGYLSKVESIELTGDVSNNITMGEDNKQLDEVVINADAEKALENVRSVKMSTNEISIEQVKKLPALFGEPDLIKNIQTQPGVLSAGEGTGSFYVRGGSADQNLILIDEAPVYDPTHVFGLFSVFNADVLKGSDLYKGGIPAKYGGRLSSILDVRTKDGNANKFGGSATLGSLSGKIMLEGPIAKQKSSFLISARRSFLEAYTPLLAGGAQNNSISFYDINAKVNWKPSNKDRFFLSSYVGRDRFSFGAQGGFDFGNTTATLRWNHLFNERIFSNTTLIGAQFDYKLQVDNPASAFIWKAFLRQFGLRQDFTYFINPKNTLTFGLHADYRKFSPGDIRPNNSEISSFRQLTIAEENALDFALYIGNEQNLSDRISLTYGLRYSLFQYIGPATVKTYANDANGLPNNVNIKVLGSKTYGEMEPVSTYHNLEPRLGARYGLTNSSSIKASYNRMVQNIHLLSNSTVPVPFNTWAPSSPYLNPQIADQVAAGYFRNFKDNTVEASAEVYYKHMSDVTDFADNAQLLLNPDVAVEYRQGTSQSYGLELYVKKNKGKLTGYTSYTLSRTTRDIPGVNANKIYLANYDRTHSLNIVGTYEIGKRWSCGAQFTYSTGRAFTIPAAKYELSLTELNPDYITERNAYRLPDFHKLDVSAVFEPQKGKNTRFDTKWVFSMYNMYGRKNTFTLYTRSIVDDEGNVIGDGNLKEVRVLWLFGIIPSVAFTINF